MFRTLYVFILIMTITEWGVAYYAQIMGSNAILFAGYCIIEICFYNYFYNKHILYKKNKFAIGLSALAIAYIVFEWTNNFIFKTIDHIQYQPYCKVISNFIIVIYTLIFFYEIANSYKAVEQERFRLNIAILITYTLTALVFLPYNYLVNEKTGINFIFWTLNVLITFLFYGYLIIMLWKNGKIHKR